MSINNYRYTLGYSIHPKLHTIPITFLVINTFFVQMSLMDFTLKRNIYLYMPYYSINDPHPEAETSPVPFLQVKVRW